LALVARAQANAALIPIMLPPPHSSTLFPYTTLFRSIPVGIGAVDVDHRHLVLFDGRLQFLDGDIGVLLGRLVREGHHRRQTHTQDRKSTRLNSSHLGISYAVFCLKKKSSGSCGLHSA